jgi:anti-anti-sigma factor
LSGELDIDSQRDAARTIATAFERAHDARVIVDLTGVTFYDVAGLRALGMLDTNRRRWTLYANPPAIVQRLMHVLNARRHDRRRPTRRIGSLLGTRAFRPRRDHRAMSSRRE